MKDVTNAPGMFARGKLSLRADRIEGVAEIKRIFEQVRGDAVSTVVEAPRPRTPRGADVRPSPTTPAARCTARRPSSTRACAPWSRRSASPSPRSPTGTAAARAAATPPTTCSAWRCRRATSRSPRRRASTACWRPAPPATTASRRRASPSPKRTASPSACPTSSAARSPTRVEVLNAVAAAARRTAPIIEEKVAASLAEPNPLDGVKLAAYYGCLLVRPPEVSGDDDPEQPMSMDDVIAACGADAVDWNMKVECCGGAFSVSRTSLRRAARPRDHRGRARATAPRPSSSPARSATPTSTCARRRWPSRGAAAAADPLHHAGRRPRPRPAARGRSASSGTSSTPSRSSRDLRRRAAERVAAEKKRRRRRRPPRPPPGPPSEAEARPRRRRPRRPRRAAPDAGGDA